MSILEELKIAQKCESDNDCIFGSLNTPCTIYMCGAGYNKDANLIKLNELSGDYIKNCQEFCPMYACTNPNLQIVKCTNNLCQTYYKPNSNTD